MLNPHLGLMDVLENHTCFTYQVGLGGGGGMRECVWDREGGREGRCRFDFCLCHLEVTLKHIVVENPIRQCIMV